MNNDSFIEAFNTQYKGKFEITEKLVSGHNGVIYKGWCTFPEEDTVFTAIKIWNVPANMDYYRYCITAFLREAEIMQDIGDANVVEFFDNGKFKYKDNDYYFVAMELLEGYTLTDVIKSTLNKMPVKMPPKELKDFYLIAKWLLSAARGLQAMHDKEIVHGDIKPDNLFVDKFDNQSVVIIDLGSAAYEKDIERFKKLENTDVYSYTKWFLSPERVVDKHPSRDSDLWALGKTARLLMTGKDLNAVTQVPEFFDKLILKMLDKDLNKRFRSAREIMAYLQIFLETEPKSAEVKHE